MRNMKTLHLVAAVALALGTSAAFADTGASTANGDMNGTTQGADASATSHGTPGAATSGAIGSSSGAGSDTSATATPGNTTAGSATMGNDTSATAKPDTTKAKAAKQRKAHPKAKPEEKKPNGEVVKSKSTADDMSGKTGSTVGGADASATNDTNRSIRGAQSSGTPSGATGSNENTAR